MTAENETETTEEKKPRAKRKVAGVDFQPKDVYLHCMESQPASVSEVAERFALSAVTIKGIVLDYCAQEGQIPHKFATRGSTASGMGKVRAMRFEGEAGDKDREPQEGSPLQFILGNAYLAAIKAEHGDTFKIEMDTDNRSVSLRIMSAEELSGE